MCKKSKKSKILYFCKKLVDAQKAYVLIPIDDIKNRHLSFPDVIQKQILIEFCDLNLSLRNPDDIDLIDKNTNETYELKSTTSYDGAVTISQNQAQNQTI